MCIIAYGQTSAGKTYTMMGTEKNPGINIRSIAELFRVCHERKNIEYKMKVCICVHVCVWHVIIIVCGVCVCVCVCAFVCVCLRACVCGM